MGTARLNLYAFVGLALVACNAILGVDENGSPPRRQGSGGSSSSGAAGEDPGAAGASGEAGAPSSGGGQAGSATGGTGAPGGSGGGGTSGRGGDGGRAAHAGSGGESGSDGGAGAGGNDGVDGPTLNEPCEELGVFACTAANRHIVLECRVAEPPHPAAGERVWLISQTCTAEAVCSPTTFTCRDVHPSCNNYDGPECRGGNLLVDCEESLVESGEHMCPWGCQAGACVQGAPNLLTVHTDVYDGQRVHWWPADVPVCFLPSAADAAMRGIVRDEVESTWGRYAELNFVGWNACTEGEPGVALEFVEDCRDRLGNLPWHGYPGDGAQMRVAICRTYVDGSGNTRRIDQEESLLRFMARHQFGHVLGYYCGIFPGNAMVRGIEHPGEENLTIAPLDLRDLRLMYGRKFSQSFATTAGRCLKLSGSAIEVTRCEDTAEQEWLAALGELISFVDPIDLYCLELDLGGAVDVRLCPDEHSVPAWRMAHARWSTPGLCVEPLHDPPLPGDSLRTTTCEPVGDPSQSWFFEVQAGTAYGYQTRVHFADSELCVTLPNATAAIGAVPVLEPCGPEGQADQVLYTRRAGSVSFRNGGFEFCFAWNGPDSDIYLEQCGTNNRKDTWILSGAIESSNGLALRVTPDVEGSFATAEPLVGLPSREQIFDYYF